MTRPPQGFAKLDPEKRREISRSGAIARAASQRALRAVGPFEGSILDLMDLANMRGPTWEPWRVFLRAVFALPMTAAERETFTHHTARQTPPQTPPRQVFAICGRRAGKTRVASLVAIYFAIRRDYHALLAPGESCIVPLLGVDKDQSAIALSYVKGTLRSAPFLRYVSRMLKEGVELKTGAKITVKAASMRTTRGYSTPAIVADELAHWRSDESSEPDREILTALLPGMLALPEPLLLGLSTPYGKSGVLYGAFDQYYGRDDADVLVWQAPSAEMNATLDQAAIARELEKDPDKNAAEYLATFRTDVQNFLSPEALEHVINRARPLELPYREELHYSAHIDPSGGSADSACLGIAHSESGRAILDVAREWRSPHIPEQVVAEMVGVLKDYHIGTVTTDHYAPGWVQDAFQRRAIECRVSAKPKSELFLELLGPINSGRVELPNHPRLRDQLVALERRTARGGKDSVDHRVGAHDDLANAAAGALVRVLERGADVNVDGSVVASVNQQLHTWPIWAGGGGGLPRERQSVYDYTRGKAVRWPGQA
jgi:hypothetical protein